MSASSVACIGELAPDDSLGRGRPSHPTAFTVMLLLLTSSSMVDTNPRTRQPSSMGASRSCDSRRFLTPRAGWRLRCVSHGQREGHAARLVER